MFKNGFEAVTLFLYYTLLYLFYSKKIIMGFVVNQCILFVLVTLSFRHQTEGLRILGMFPLHAKSHFVMCERLAKGLAEKGHQVDVYSHFPQKKQIPNYTDYSLQGSLPPTVNNISFDFIVQNPPNNIITLVKLGNIVCELMNLPVFQELFNKLKKNQPYDIIIVETFVSHCFFAWGRYLNIPVVGVMTSTLLDWYNEPLGNPLNTAVVPSAWSGLFHPMNFWERLENTFTYHYLKIQLAYHITQQNRYVEQFFEKGYPHAYDLVKDFDLLLVNSHYTIDGVRPYAPSIIQVGGLHIVDDGTKLPNEVQKWLDDSKHGCIYFSFGSMVRIETFPKPILDSFYAAFKAIAPVRVLIKIAKPEELPARLPSNVMTQKWYSQLEVLKHKNIKAFLTHGGLMSTQESLSAGVPTIGIPLFADQYINVKTQVRKKVGVMVALDNISEKTITDSFKEILNNPVYKENAKKLSKKFFDRPMSPIDTAAFWVEYIARHGKKSLRSPVLDLPWWQSQLIDVYGFILLVLAIVYYILKIVFKKLLSCCLSSTWESKKIKKA